MRERGNEQLEGEIMMVGDLNARVGEENTGRKRAMGIQGLDA